MTPEVVTFTEARLSDEVLGVRAEYLDAARRTIDDNFGSLDGYLRARVSARRTWNACAAHCWPDSLTPELR